MATATRIAELFDVPRPAAEKAVELGYAIAPDHGPSGKLDHWAIAGIPAAVTDRFSKRSDEIDIALESTGFRSHRARQIAAYNSRDPKGDESPESLLVRWLDETGRDRLADPHGVFRPERPRR